MARPIGRVARLARWCRRKPAIAILSAASLVATAVAIAITGALVQWLRDNIGLIKASPEIEDLAKSVDDNGGVYFVPAFSGLFAPYWRPDARGVIAGLTGYVTKGHLARAALDYAVGYAREREQFGQPIIEFQGLGFLLADMAAAVDSARATYLDAARRRDAGMPYSRQASVAKLIASDAAMKVTTDAVQVFGGYGYTRDFRVERYMREAKITQIFEGTNQIQRLVIARSLAKR